VAWLAVFVVARGAEGAHRRPRFEPADLEMEKPGVVDVDLQFGFSREGGDYRLVAPDFEIDVGITENLELDLDGTMSWVGSTPGALPPRKFQPDNLWLSLKVGLVDLMGGDGVGGGVGVQVGPRLPTFAGSSGPGFEALVLGGLALPRTHLVLNVGAFVDPALVMGPHPGGVVGGLDLSVDLDRAGTWTFDADVFGTWFLSSDPSEFGVSAGATWSARPWLDFSVAAIGGWLGGGPSIGGLIGVSPKFPLRRGAGGPSR